MYKATFALTLLLLGTALVASGMTPPTGTGSSTATGAAAATKTKASPGGASREHAELARPAVRRIGWDELMPEGEEQRLEEMYRAQLSRLYSGRAIAEGSLEDMSIQIGTFNTVAALDGKKIRIPGYGVPFEFGMESTTREFLLVPYYGACIHSPPPPPNQTIYVTSKNPVPMKFFEDAIWVEGVLRAKRQDTDLADAAYTLELTGIEEYRD
jgi:hypothetical protein